MKDNLKDDSTTDDLLNALRELVEASGGQMQDMNCVAREYRKYILPLLVGRKIKETSEIFNDSLPALQEMVARYCAENGIHPTSITRQLAYLQAAIGAAGMLQDIVNRWQELSEPDAQS